MCNEIVLFKIYNDALLKTSTGYQQGVNGFKNHLVVVDLDGDNGVSNKNCNTILVASTRSNQKNFCYNY